MTPSLVTRRSFLAGSAAGLLASETWLSAEPQKSIEFRRGGMTYRRLGQTDLYPSLLSFGSHTDPADRGVITSQNGSPRQAMVVAKLYF